MVVVVGGGRRSCGPWPWSWSWWCGRVEDGAEVVVVTEVVVVVREWVVVTELNMRLLEVGCA